MGKASFQRTVIDITKKHGINDKVLFGVNRQQASGVSSTSSIGTGGGSSVAPVTGFLKVSGGSMLGPIAYYPASQAISASSLDVSSTGAYSSTVYLVVSADTNLDTISGAVNAGQRLTLYNGSVHTVTIRDHTVSGSNITTLPYGTSYSLGPLGKIDLFYDAGLQRWNVIAPISTGADTALSNLTNPTAINQDLNMGNHKLLDIQSIRFHSSGNFITFETNSAGTVFDWLVNGFESFTLSNTGTNGILEINGTSISSINHPVYKTVNNNSSPFGGNTIGGIWFDGFDSGLTRLSFGKITCKTDSVTAGVGNGSLRFSSLTAGFLTEKMYLDSTTFTVNTSFVLNGTSDFEGNIGIGDGFNISVGTTTGTKIGTSVSQKIGFWNKTPAVKQTVTGSRAGNNALQSLLSALNTIGIITDSSTA